MLAWRRQFVGVILLCGGCFGSLFFLSGGSAAKDIPDGELHPTESTAPTTEIDSSSATQATCSDPEDSTDVFNAMRADLANAQAKASALTSYTAIMEMQEEVNGNLRPLDLIQIKIRQQPFSVYMRWSESHQEALFVDGQNDNRLLVKPTKGLAGLKRLWRLDPNCRMAKQSCRYPITDSGIEKLVSRIQDFYATRDDWASVVKCSVSDATVAKSPVTAYEIRYRDVDASPDYEGSRFCFDKSTELLIAVDNFGWSDAQEPRLIERYVYHTINQDIPLQDNDFAEANPDYQFVAR
ncbi:MAG: DUF1571 domain-containing protein [Fuerstia sp.]|nr:DUF1571 domain-containing protein [Fuerstiella sp.]